MFIQVLADEGGQGFGWGQGGCCWLVCVMKGGDDRGESAVGVGTKVAAKAPINTLITAWQEQAVPVKDTLGHWRVRRGVGGAGG